MDSVSFLGGHKIERNIDLTVSLPGRDFELIREYSSDPELYGSWQPAWFGAAIAGVPGQMGSSWTANVFKTLSGDVDNPSFAYLYLGGVPLRTTQAFEPSDLVLDRFYPRSSGSMYIDLATADVPDIGTAQRVHRLVEPGKMVCDFARNPDPMPTTANGLGMEDLAGYPLVEYDAHGNAWRYEYEILVDNTTGPIDEVILKSIYLNWNDGGTPVTTSDDTWAARVDFFWNGQSSAPSPHDAVQQFVSGVAQDNFGRIAEIRVVRPTTSGEIITQKAEYLYFEDIKGITDPTGVNPTTTLGEQYDANDGDLCEVVISTRVDADVDAPSAGEEFYERVWQYRYYTPNNDQLYSIGSGSSSVTLRGQEHQLLAVFYPQQIEFFADHYIQEKRIQNPTLALASVPASENFDESVRGAARNLRWIMFNDTPGQSSQEALDAYWEDYFLPNEYWHTLFDVAGKIISYHPNDMNGNRVKGSRVKTQIVNAGDGSSGSSCGCGSGGSGVGGFRLGKRFDYLYRRYNWDTKPDGIPDSATITGQQSDGYSIQIVESGASLDLTSGQLEYVPYRIRGYDYYWPSQIKPSDVEAEASGYNFPATSARSGIAWKVASVVAEADPTWDFSDTLDPFQVANKAAGTGRRWVTLFEYTTDEVQPGTGEDFSAFHQVAQTITPSANNWEEYDPALGGTSHSSPILPSVNSTGLVREQAYAESWRSSATLRQGDTTTTSTPVQITRAATRPDLVTQIQRSPGTGPTGDTPVETTTIAYGFHTFSVSSTNPDLKIVAWQKNDVTAETQAQNGPDSATTYSSYRMYDTSGQLRWTQAADGGLTYYGYDDKTGAVTKMVQDASPSGSYVSSDATLPGSFPGLSAVWTAPSGSFEELEHEFTLDELGRTTSHTDPSGNTRYTRYEVKDTDNVESNGTLAARGIPFMAVLDLPHKLSSGGFDGPISITWRDAGRRSIRSSQYIASGSGTYDPLNDDFALSTEVARSDSELMISGLPLRTRVWHDVGVTTALSGTSREHTNAGSYVTDYQYDTLGRLTAMIDPEGGTVQNTSYDILDRALATSSGTVTWTSGVPAASTVQVSAVAYDSGQSAIQGVGNGNLTYQRQLVTASSGDDRITKRWYDYRDRLRGVLSPLAPHSVTEYDDLDRVVETAILTTATGFTGGVDPDGSLPEAGSASANRSTYFQTLYNNRGMAFQSRIAVDPVSGSTDFLSSNKWFDSKGRTIAQWHPNGVARKVSFDRLDRPVTEYATDRNGDAAPGASGNHADASSITDDRIIQQTDYAYVADGKDGAGAAELVTNRMRLHNYAGTDPLDGSNSIAMFTLTEFDDASRGFKTHRYGVNDASFTSGTSAPSRPSVTAGAPDTGALVTEIGFDLWGRTVSATSPDDQTTQSVLDSMSRQTATVEGFEFIDDDDIDLNTTTDNWEVDWAGSPYGGTGPDDADRVTTFLYDGNSNVVKRSAHFGNGTMQTTQYVYGTTIGAGATDSLIASSGLLQKVHYPDETTGAASTQAAYTVVYGYNRLGELRGMFDQNQTTHVYTRDDLGRVTSDAVTITSSDIDGTINEITTSYDTHGRVSQVLSKNGSAIKNGVAFGYSGLHQVESVAQNPDGDPLASGTPTVGYEYENAAPSANGGNYSRISEVAYPTEYDTGTTATETVALEYGKLNPQGVNDSIDNLISRVTGLEVNGWDSLGDNLVDYSYLGAGLPVKVHYPKPTAGLGLDYTKAFDGTDGASSGTYHGFDQYGRVIWHPWVSDGYTTGTNAGFADRTPLVARAYEYDDDSNRTRDYDGRPGAVPTDRDWKYEYDDLDRLTTALRGQQTPGSGVDDFTVSVGSENWDLDILGNWEDFGIDTGGVSPVAWSASENRTRTHNMANEILTRDGEQGAGPGGTTQVFDHTYDDNGNIRSNTATALSNSLKYTHDAWNRLVKVERWVDGGPDFSILENEYNGLNWRVRRRMDLATGAYDGIDEEREYYYSPSWQLLEERIDRDNDGTMDERAQQFWGVRYIDDAVARRLDRDNDGVWTEAANDNWYYLTDAMYSVRAIADHDGSVHTRVDYTPYGVAMHRYAADVDGNGLLNFLDLSAFLTNLNTAGSQPLQPGDPGYDPDADLNADGFASAPFFELGAFNTRLGGYSTSPALNAGWIDNPSDANGPDNSVGYDGYWFDLAGATDARSTGTYSVRHRSYDPGMGSWLERDPLGFVDGSHLYQSVLSSPLTYSDPSGLCAGCQCKNGKCRIKLLAPPVMIALGYTIQTNEGEDFQKWWFEDDKPWWDLFDLEAKTLEEIARELAEKGLEFASKRVKEVIKGIGIVLEITIPNNFHPRSITMTARYGPINYSIQRCDQDCSNPSRRRDKTWGGTGIKTMPSGLTVDIWSYAPSNQWPTPFGLEEITKKTKEELEAMANGERDYSREIIKAIGKKEGCNGIER